MSLKEYSKEQLQEMSLIEMAFELLKSRKEAVSFKEIMDELTSLLGLSDAEVKQRIAQFYTDLNIDGRFLGLGDNRWGLRVWYPIDQVEEEVVTDIKPKKKKAKKAKEEDLDLDDYDELDEEDIDYDDIDGLEDEEDELIDEDDDLLEEDDEELDDDDLIEKDEEYDLGDDDEVLEEDELDLDEDEEEL
ncbi:DNA-directed RNA polymerase subunit delta [Bacillus sp. FJAT-29790]|uniref:DNA-directed RNA polymerase subunit delta n=1 Tax=Bacillus sp. FJAT-29790 TaxID=1895002 RepID=UPI001C2238DA|nr:DNA-directed RNA polymerase subunit delta [Bacillus sp. FJAT-29790]MBU8881021.1 DNA-directed RNA polymerase subunit delta [Bacillus sp. FJAT-29790]